MKEPHLHHLAEAVESAVGEAVESAVGEAVESAVGEAVEVAGADDGAADLVEAVEVAAVEVAAACAEAPQVATAEPVAEAEPAAAAAPPRRPPSVAYAEALLRQVKRALRTVPEDELGPAFVALAAFVADPQPHTFLAASRALHDARYGRAARKIMVAHDGRLFQRGLEALRSVPGLDPAHAEVLTRLPMDGRTGQRLMAVAQLLEVHIELAGRAAAASREIRRKLGPPPKAPATPGWRRAGGARRT